MSRRHLESALVAGALIESGLTPCFRFTRTRFARYFFPPQYGNPGFDPENPSEPAKGPTVTQFRGATATLPATCTCCTTHVSTNKNTSKDDHFKATFTEERCEDYDRHTTEPCKIHTEEYIRKHPWRGLLDDYAVHAVQFSGDARQLLVGSANTSVRVIDTANETQRILPRPSKWSLGMPITAIRFMPPKLIWAIACTSQGDVFAFRPDHEGFETLFKEPQQTHTLDLSPDGHELATAGVDRRIRIYTLQPGSVIGLPTEQFDPCDQDGYNYTGNPRVAQKIRTFNQQLNRTDPGRDERLQFPGGRPNQIVDTTARPYVLTRCYGTPDATDPPDVPEPGSYITTKLDPPLREYVPTSPGWNITQGHSKRVMALRYHPQKSAILVSAGWDNMVKIWDTRLQTGPVWQIYGPHVASPDGLDVDDNYILTASWRARRSIEIWDLRALTSTSGRGDASGGSLPPCHPDASAKGDSSLGTIDQRSGGPAETIPISGPAWFPNAPMDGGEYPYAGRLLPSRAVVAAGSGFHEVRIVGRDTLLPVARIPMDSVVQSLDSILDGRYIGAGCSSGTVALIGLA